MKKNYIISFAIIFSSAAFSVFLISSALAQADIADIKYPIAELGNCKSEADCRVYCDREKNIEVCLDFAEKNNLMTKDEAEAGKKFTKIGEGPGGCADRDSCDAYCQNMDHMDECLAFAEKNDLIPQQELDQMKKIQAAVKRGVQMPSCKTKKECDAFCGNPENMEVCMNFALEAGIMSEQEQKESQQVLAAIKKGIKPPACGGKEQCDAYCSDESHFDECMAFAEAAGFISGKDLEMAKKTKGRGPGGCRGKEECDAFCQAEGNMDVCIQFSVENGLMSKEDAEMARKTGGKGPGGCKGKEECEAFCNVPENQQTCFEFGRDNGMIPEEQLQEIEKGKQQFRETMSQMPQEVSNCLASSLGADTVEKFKSGAAMPPKDMGDTMKRCFEENMKQRGPGGPGEGGDMAPGEGGGSGIPPGMQAGPGGCASPEECQKVCAENPDACKSFGSSSGNGQDGFEIRENMEFREGMPPGNLAPGEMIPGANPMPGGEGGQYGPPPGTEYAPGTMPPGNFVPPQGQMLPQGQMSPEGSGSAPGELYVPPQYIAPGEPGSGGSFIVPNEMGPGPGTAPPANMTPPADQIQSAPQQNFSPPPENSGPPPGESAPPPPPSSFKIDPEHLLGRVLNLLGNY